MVISVSIQFQSTFPRGERQELLEKKESLAEISIHVPSWGTTRIRNTRVIIAVVFQSTFPLGERRSRSGHLIFPEKISIHVPSWGTTFRRPFYHMDYPYFNPRSLVGNDEIRFLVSPPKYGISIHVPSWGTTRNLIAFSPSVVFQSTFHRGERLFTDIIVYTHWYFNPRSLVGNDGKFSQIFFVFLCNKYNFSTFYYPFSLFFSVIHVTFLIFVVRILPAFYVYF